MRTAVLLSFALSLSAVAAPVPKALKAKKSDAELLEGRWEIVSIDQGKGPKTPVGVDVTIYWEFTRGKLFIGSDDGEPRTLRRLELDTTTKPKQLSFGWDKVLTSLAIYELYGDTLRLAVGELDEPRPMKFAGTERASLYLLRRITKE